MNKFVCSIFLLSLAFLNIRAQNTENILSEGVLPEEERTLHPLWAKDFVVEEATASGESSSIQDQINEESRDLEANVQEEMMMEKEEQRAPRELKGETTYLAPRPQVYVSPPTKEFIPVVYSAQESKGKHHHAHYRHAHGKVNHRYHGKGKHPHYKKKAQAIYVPPVYIPREVPSKSSFGLYAPPIQPITVVGTVPEKDHASQYVWPLSKEDP